MKNNNFIAFVTALLIGLIIGGGVIGLLWHNSLKAPKEEGSKVNKEITVQQKLQYLEEYKKTIDTRQFWSLTRVSFYMQQYDAMTYLLKKNPKLKGFRFTPAIVGDPFEGVVVSALDANGEEVTTCPPVLTGVEPCPPNCDDVKPEPPPGR
jgi:hypothetical protein